MPQTYIDQLNAHVGESVILKGWLYNSRSSGKLVFLQLRDGTGIVQCVVFKATMKLFSKLQRRLGRKARYRDGHGKRGYAVGDRR
jgi:aspartyl/asparaginyl-tRNA synthetase